MTLVNTSSSNILAWLRQSSQQDMLILINISNGVVDDYSVDLEANYFGSTELLRGSQVEAGEIKTVNGISGYQPIPSLSPRSGYIIHLQ